MKIGTLDLKHLRGLTDKGFGLSKEVLGTVIGIMSSFQAIGTQGSASLAVVAPGISGALVATAAGLAAAIPAVIGYNYFVGRVRHWTTEMDNFALELANLIERRLVRSTKPF